ncbi:MAG: nicotinate phosphoribosyltransferase [Simkaniaceae bacterium]|nr:nicotinate phosphoribosyltransferase [Simkaniaceae bacterium]
MTYLGLMNLALLTDLYQLTMAYGYWKRGIGNREAVFHHFFRKKPFGGEFAISCGLETLIDFIDKFQFDSSDIDYLSQLQGADQKPLFEEAFLEFLSQFRFDLTIDAMPEGTPVFPFEPMVRVQGPIMHAQLLESPLLNILNFQTLVATKAMRVCCAAGESEVVEFGMRRAQGIDGALSSSRAAYVGGCSSTSHVLAGKQFNIPVKGTQAHSWVMCFDDEKESFRAFAEVMPGNTVALVDTYDSVSGTKKAIEVAKEMHERGERMLGVRIDSGDLAEISKRVRKMLDDAGFEDMKIMASNELEEEIIKELKHQGAQIDLWGVGTALVTGRGQGAIDGVYKLSMVREEGGEWSHRMKLSEQMEKITNPGILQVRRFSDGDMIFDTLSGPSSEMVTISSNRDKRLEGGQFQDLLIPIYKGGKRVYTPPALRQVRENTLKNLAQLPETLKRFKNPTPHPVGLEKSLHEIKLSLIESLRSPT